MRRRFPPQVQINGDLRRDRAQRAEIREEVLKTSLRSTPGLPPLTAWRGTSGRRYVFAIHAPAAAATAIREASGAPLVVLAASREGEGFAARPVKATFYGADASPEGFIDRTVRAGANEVHVCRLVESEAEARAIVADLTAPAALAA